VAPACAGRKLVRLMFYNYVLKSVSHNRFYVGFTEDINKRLYQHNSGFVKSTKSYKPFVLFFAQITNTRNEARDLEKYLKIRWNKESLIKLIS